MAKALSPPCSPAALKVAGQKTVASDLHANLTTFGEHPGCDSAGFGGNGMGSSWRGPAPLT